MTPDHKTDDANSNRRSQRVLALLRNSGLRPTRQRLVLADLLFGGEDRHVSAEVLHAEAVAKGEHVSLATVYNTLHQFRGAGLVRELAIDAARAYFDTNTSNHNHFFIEADGMLLDIPGDGIKVAGLPKPPEGMRISHIDVVVRLVPIDPAAADPGASERD
jgi:Fur family transcriptional regulator, iron response regulator